VVGKAEGWANKMFFYPDSLVMDTELTLGFSKYLGKGSGLRLPPGKEKTISSCFYKMKTVKKIWWKIELFSINNIKDLEKNWKTWGLENFNPDRFMTRKELCVMLDKCFMLFGSKNLPMDLNGKLSFVYGKF